MGAEARILFVTSNGTGLGHLTRSMAIARRLAPGLEPLFVTFSAAAPVVGELGLPVEYLASYDRPGAGDDWRWTRRSRARLEAIVGEAGPRVVVFDGTHPYERLLPALRSAGATLVWCRRAMWRAGADTAPLWRSHLFDHVLEPGEHAAAADTGPTVARRGEVLGVDPIVLLDRDDLVPRADAERELGLEPGRTNVLVQLGQGEGVREANRRSLARLVAREDVQVAAAASALAALGEVPPGVIRLPATYPISRYLAAFDLAVAAAGYNVFHELIHLGVPALYVPMARQTDDQAARARHAAATGIGVACTGPDDPELEARLDELLDIDGRGRMRERLAALETRNGADEAAGWIRGLAAGDGSGDFRPDSPASRRRPHRQRRDWVLRLRRAWIFAASVPRTVLRLGTQVLTRPRVRVVVLALGVGGDEIGRELGALIDDAGGAERVLVVTDSLDFAPLLAAGVGFEQAPRPGSRQAELAGAPYERFLAERLRLVLAERPRPRRVVVLGEAPGEVTAIARAGGAPASG